MKSKVAHIRLPQKEIELIDKAVNMGYYLNRTDFIKSGVRILIHEIAKIRLKELKKERKQASPKEILKASKDFRRKIYREIWTT